MRAWFTLGVLAIGLCLCGTAGAQVATTASNSSAVRTGGNQRVNDVSPNLIIRARTRLRDLFGGASAVPTRIQGTTTTVPDPSSPDYFKPFNIRQVGGR